MAGLGDEMVINDAMIEKAARGIAAKIHEGGDYGMTGDDAYESRPEDFAEMARAALAAALPLILEEVAKVADKSRHMREAQQATATSSGLRIEARDFESMKFEAIFIATAIRAMGEKTNG